MDVKQLQSWLHCHRKSAYALLILCSGTLGGSIGILAAPFFGR
jgi:hypothetical protein